MFQLLKKISSIFVLFLMICFPQSSFAYKDGLINGKSMVRGSAIGDIQSYLSQATDNDVNSYASLYTHGSSFGYMLWYKFNEPISIYAYQLQSNMSLKLALYDADKKELFNTSMRNDAAKMSFTEVPNVSYVSVINTSNSVPNIYEFDVFMKQQNDDNPPVDPPDNPPSSDFDHIGPGLMPWSDKIPSLGYSPDIKDIFRNFYVNWSTLSPVLNLLYGVLLGFFILKIIKKQWGD